LKDVDRNDAAKHSEEAKSDCQQVVSEEITEEQVGVVLKTDKEIERNDEEETSKKDIDDFNKTERQRVQLERKGKKKKRRNERQKRRKERETEGKTDKPRLTKEEYILTLCSR
jgi:hypothetical protein